MKAQNDIASYVSDLRGRLHLSPEVIDRIVGEAEAHLHDRAAAHISNGMDRREAESLAVAEFGPAWRVALRFRLAYLGVGKVLAWTAAILAIPFIVNEAIVGFLSIDPSIQRNILQHWPQGVAIGVAEIIILLAIGLVVIAIFPRRRVLGAGVVSLALAALEQVPKIVGTSRSFGSFWDGHIWNGWQSGFCGRLEVPGNQFRQLVLFRDSAMLEELLMMFACILLAVWAAGAIRAKIAGRRARRAIA